MTQSTQTMVRIRSFRMCAEDSIAFNPGWAVTKDKDDVVLLHIPCDDI